MSRNTVRKVPRSGETSFEYERVVQPRPKLGRWAAELDGLLAGNAAKSAREQLTLIRIFEELRGRGYDGGYDAVRRYARRWSKERGQSTAAAYVPLSFAPGEAYQFDWSHEVVLLNGVTVIVKAGQSWNERMWSNGGPVEPSPTIDQAINGGFPWLEIRCSRCKTPRDVDLCVLQHVSTTCVHDLAGRLICRKCRGAGKRPAAELLPLGPRPRHSSTNQLA